ncbi:MAG TPA: methylated-DNA--[protein]-cysteine S-methyltransferase [Symbiobacteriaceae bacterium]|jgi:O-6-methylguanine DNA methyltransferase
MTAQLEVIIGQIDTPAGPFGALFSLGGLCRLTFATEPLDWCEAWANKWLPGAARVGDDGRLAHLAAELQAYFTGRLRVFDTPVDLFGTPFQREVWAALRTVPYGEIRTYAQIAETIGRPKAVRAVGAANGANPVPILVPCHRVIGSDGKLRGYAGGLDLKSRLLEREGAPA